MHLDDPRSLLAALNKLESLRDSKVAKHVRQYVRFVARGDAELLPMEREDLDQRPLVVMLRDLSRGGMGFISQNPLPPNSLWRIGFLHQEHIISQQAMIVRHCSKVQDNVHLVGCQFCLETGTMVLQGIDPALIRDGDNPQGQKQNFLTPNEVK